MNHKQKHATAYRLALTRATRGREPLVDVWVYHKAVGRWVSKQISVERAAALAASVALSGCVPIMRSIATALARGKHQSFFKIEGAIASRASMLIQVPHG